MKRLIILGAAAVVLAGCGPHVDIGDAIEAHRQMMTDAQYHALWKAADACVQGEPGFWPGAGQTLMRGPGFEKCFDITFAVTAEFDRRVAKTNAEDHAAEIKAEAADLAARRAIVGKAAADLN